LQSPKCTEDVALDQDEYTTTTTTTTTTNRRCSRPRPQQCISSVEGKYKDKYGPQRWDSEDEIAVFSVYQDITKQSYFDHALQKRNKSSPPVVQMIRNAKYNIACGLASSLECLDKGLDSKDCNARFKTLCPEVSIDQFQKSFFCRILNHKRTRSYYGECFICDGCFCYSIDVVDSQTCDNKLPLKLKIALVDVVAVTKAGRKYNNDRIQSKKSTSKSEPLEIIPLTKHNVKPSVIQFWTTDKKIHQFFGFAGHYDNAFHRIYSTWKANAIKD